MKISLTKSSFYNENVIKRKLAKFLLNSERFSMGRECQKFERLFAKKQKRKYAVMINSGSSANLILIQALLNLNLLKKGDPVGVSALTWSTNVMPLIQLGLRPILVDCEKNTLNVSPSTLAKTVNSIKALFLTNALGFCDDIGTIKSLCKKHGILFLEDNCEALGSKAANDRLLGNFGLASTFSFFVGHHISTIEGGMVCTDNKELYEMLLMVRAHGWDRNLSATKQRRLQNKFKVNKFYAKYAFYDLAFNVRPTEIAGLLGNLQIHFWNKLVQKREQNFRQFQKAAADNKDLIKLELNHMSKISNFNMPVVARNKIFFRKYKAKFEKAGIEIRPIIAGSLTRQPFYRKYVKKIASCPNAEHIHANGFYFPNNAELTTQEIAFLKRLLTK